MKLFSLLITIVLMTVIWTVADGECIQTNITVTNTYIFKVDEDTQKLLQHIGSSLNSRPSDAYIATQWATNLSQILSKPLLIKLDGDTADILNKMLTSNSYRPAWYSTIYALIAAAITGAVGYYLANFVMQPIIVYRRIKQETACELIVYANAIAIVVGDNDEVRVKRVQERMTAQRKRSAELTAAYISLPICYRKLLKFLKEDPAEAASELLGLSNTADWQSGTQRVQSIQKLLRIPRIAA